MPSISLFTQNISYVFSSEEEIKNWIHHIVNSEGKKLGDVNVVLVSDEDLLEINRSFLNRDYLTDTITFPLDDGRRVSGEAYISLDRIKENATELNIDMADELFRVIAHSVLHLIGYTDGSVEEKEAMRSREDFYLNLRPR